jgi:hypothetical protein
LYEKKLSIENDKYLKLDSKIKEDIFAFDDKHKIMEKKYSSALDLL